MQTYKHVVIIGVDGAGAFFRDTATPHIDRIFMDGATSYDMLTAYPTISAQCWGSMLLGVAPEFHQLTNGLVSSFPYDTDSPYPSVFRVVREAYPTAELASFCNWNPINIGIIEDGLGVHKDTAGDEELTEKILTWLDDHAPTLLFVQFDSIDGAGHGHGYGSPEHLAAITASDGWIGRIYDKYMEKDLLQDTLFIVTADHGGTPGGSHGGDSDAELYVFLGLCGRTVEKGTIADPDVRDIAAITAYALGLPLPETWTATIPDGVFTGVSGRKRPENVTPPSLVRHHDTIPTPADKTFLDALPTVKAYFPFDGIMADVTGQVPVQGTGKLYHTDGYFGDGLVLDDGHVTLSGVRFGQNSFSIAAWVKLSSFASDPAIFGNKDWHSGSNPGFVLCQEGGAVHFNAGNGKDRIDVNARLPKDFMGWVHVLLAVDRTVGKVSIYVDFALAVEANLPDTLRDVSFDALDFNLGQDGTGTYGTRIALMLDEVILMDGVPDAGQVEGLKKHYR